MRKITYIWHTLRQIDEQAGSFNPYFNFANHCFDLVVQRHRKDFASIVRSCRKMAGRK